MSQKSMTSHSRGSKANGTVKQKEFGAKHVEAKVPKSDLPLFYVTLVVVVILCLILCCCGSPEQQLSQFVINICNAMFYLISAKELYIFGRQRAAGLNLNRTNKDNFVQMFLIPGVGVTLQFSGSSDTMDKYIFFLSILFKCVLVVSKVIILFVLKINRNEADSTRITERTPNAVGPGLARCFFSYLENVIKGKCGSPRYNDAINMYRQEEGIPDCTAGKDWILNKVMILFPEARESRGSVEELVQKFDKDRKSKKGGHRLCFEKIKHDYELNGQKRVSWMEVLKVYNGDEVGYVVIAENRPLNTLYRMVEENVISEEVFKIQFHAYKNELKRILDECKECKGNYEFFHYKDGSRLCDFGSAVIAKITSMRKKELN